MGRIADTAKSIVPITWDALRTDARVGDTALASRESYITSLIFGSDITEEQETALNGLVVEYAAKRLAIEVIDMGIDFWMVMSETETVQQPTEINSYPERLEHLKEKKKSLLVDLVELEAIVAPLIPNLFTRKSAGRPLISTIDDELLTPNPQDFGPEYAELET